MRLFRMSEAAPRWRKVIRGIQRRLALGGATVMAGGVAFFGFLALFPALFATLSLYTLVADLREVQERASAVAGLLPSQVHVVLRTELLETVSQSRSSLGIELVASVLVACWSAAKGTYALMVAVAATFNEPDSRSRRRIRMTALLLTIAMIVSAAAVLAAFLAGPRLLVRLGLSDLRADLVTWMRWPVLGAVLFVVLGVLYHHARAPRASPKRPWFTTGSLIATVLWLSGSALFSWFVARYTSHGGLDGSIAALTVLLSWFLVSAYVVILGAAIDAETGA